MWGLLYSTREGGRGGGLSNQKADWQIEFAVITVHNLPQSML
jgi:hypothetical protein